MNINNLFYLSFIAFTIGSLLMFFVTMPLENNPEQLQIEIKTNIFIKIIYNLWLSLIILGMALLTLWILLGVEFEECQQ